GAFASLAENKVMVDCDVDYVKKFPLSMAGIVYVKVTGDIEIGDLLVSAYGKEGYAMASKEYKAGTVIGKALEIHSEEKSENNKIKMLVMRM
ncbi:hypothetical protein ACFL3D_05465, partial [Candidatus Omnitrophota bacterium]